MRTLKEEKRTATAAVLGLLYRKHWIVQEKLESDAHIEGGEEDCHRRGFGSAGAGLPVAASDDPGLFGW